MFPPWSFSVHNQIRFKVRELMAVADVLDRPDEKPEADRNRVGTPEVQDLDKQKGTLLTPLPFFIDKEISYVEFNASQVAVLEKSKKATVLLRRKGNTESEISVRVETIDGKCRQTGSIRSCEKERKDGTNSGESRKRNNEHH